MADCIKKKYSKFTWFIYELLVFLLIVAIGGINEAAYAFDRNVPKYVGISSGRAIKTLSLADGMAGEVVNRVVTDHSGRIWIATNNGVNMYNGSWLVTFPIPAHDYSMVNVHDLCETDDGCLYAATDNGVYKFDYAWNKIAPTISEARCLTAVGDQLYIGNTQGLFALEGKKLKVVWNKFKEEDGVRHCIVDEDGVVWFISANALYSYRPSGTAVKMYPVSFIKDETGDFSQFAKAGNRIFIGTTFSGLHIYNLAAGTTEKVKGVGNVVMTVRQSHDGFVCVATDGAGAYLIDPENCEVVEHYTADNSELPSNAVYSFYRDERGANWFGLMRYGLSYSLPTSNLFQPYASDNFTTRGVNVRSFLIRGHESLIGTNNGCWYTDANRHLSRYLSPEELGGHIVNGVVWWNGAYYIGTYDGGVRKLDTNALTLSTLSAVPQLAHTTAGDIKVGPDSCLWIGSGNGLFIIRRDGTFLHLSDKNSNIVSGDIVSIAFDAGGKAWLSGASGVSVYDSASGELSKLNVPDSLSYKQSHLHITSGSDEKFYLHNGPRLLYAKADMSSYGHVVLPPVLAHCWLRGFVDDKNGHYWLATEIGLFRLSYDCEEILHFGTAEGLLGEINALQMDDEDSLWVATSQGLYAIDSTRISEWMQVNECPIQLFNMRRGTDLLSDADQLNINDEKHIQLTWNIRSEVFQAEAIMLDYAQEKGRLFEYRVDGSAWMTIATGQPLDVRHLLLGVHKLDVRCSGMPATKVTYTITVVPSAAAIIELVVLLIALISLFIFYRYRKSTKVLLSERSEMEDALMAAEEELRNDNEEPIQKYQNVKLDEQECEDVVRRMRELLEDERLFTNPDLKRTDLADRLHVSPTRLSQIFTLYLKENYYEFVNRYRLAEFKHLIAEGEYRRFTITALSEQCGFKKTSFFTTFRKVEGMTPAEYLKKKNISVKF